MTCREFTKTIEGRTLAELSSAADADLLTHQHDCASCAALLQQHNSLALALQTLRGRTATMEAPALVEQNVLRAFRQAPATNAAPVFTIKPKPAAFRLSNFFGWRTYAAAAAALVIGLGVGLWLSPHPHKTAQPPTARTEQPAPASVDPSQAQQQLPVQATASNSEKPNPPTPVVGLQRPSPAAALTVAQNEQAQGYTPLMLCDPISCSGDAEVVRMELPATAGDGSSSTQMADVIVGEDGLVRAIRIVQQQ
jgi:hypothetical protein